MKKVFN